MRAIKRQKLYTGVKEKSRKSGKTAKTVQLCKGKVAKGQNSGRNFTRV